MTKLPKSAYEETPRFNSIEEAIVDLREGRMIILVDDEDRENEGDLVCAAEKVTPEIINALLATVDAAERESIEALLTGAGLSPLEHRVAVAVSQGERKAAIARRLGLAPSTVRVTWGRARIKLRSDRAIVARQHSLRAV